MTGNIMSNETSPTQHHPNCIGSVAPPPPPPIASTNLSSIDRDITIRDNDSLDLYFMSPDAYRAAEAIDFIAEHLRNEDQYLQVSPFFELTNLTKKKFIFKFFN